MEKLKWHDRLFGKKLIRCDTVNNNTNNFDLISTSEVLSIANITGVYFSFANINLQSDEFINKLKDLYDRLRNENCMDEKKFEVIQVVMWAHNDNYGDIESSHRESLMGLPWFAMPFSEIDLKNPTPGRALARGVVVYLERDARTISFEFSVEKYIGIPKKTRDRRFNLVEGDEPKNKGKTRLSRRYRIKSGVPTLVLLGRDGSTVSVSAQEKLLEDPSGTNFPWRPRPVDQVLKDVVLHPGGTFYSEHKNFTKEDIRYEDLPDGIRGFYFSANWCPPCRAFTPQLADIYRIIRKKEPNFEIIFVSSDRSAESFRAYVETMPWVTVPFQQTAVRAELAQLYGIRGIPTLLLLDSNGHVITMDARTELAEDPSAQYFPWKPRPVNILTERYLTRLYDFPAVVLFVDGEDTEVQFAESVLNPAAEEYYKTNNINFNSAQEDFFLSLEEDPCLQFLIAVDSETSDILRDIVGLDDVLPLLVAIDLPKKKVAVMEYGAEINNDTVNNFVQKLLKNDLQFIDIIDDKLEATKNL